MAFSGTDKHPTRELSEMYRGYEIAQTDWGWFNIRRQSFGVASFHSIEEARKAVDATLTQVNHYDTRSTLARLRSST